MFVVSPIINVEDIDHPTLPVGSRRRRMRRRTAHARGAVLFSTADEAALSGGDVLFAREDGTVRAGKVEHVSVKQWRRDVRGLSVLAPRHGVIPGQVSFRVERDSEKRFAGITGHAENKLVRSNRARDAGGRLTATFPEDVAGSKVIAVQSSQSIDNDLSAPLMANDERR